MGELADAVHRKLHAAVVLQPEQAGRLRIVPVVVGGHDQHVEVAVAIEIDGVGAGRALEVRDSPQLEPEIQVRRPVGRWFGARSGRRVVGMPAESM